MIITGCPRSGTGYIAKLFTHAGIPCGHEQKYYNYQSVNLTSHVKNPQAESSWLAIPHLHKYKNILHIVREPMKVISSMMNVDFLQEGEMEFVAEALPDILKLEGIERYVYFWTQWNMLIEKHTDKRYRIEDINKDPRKFITQFIEPKVIYINNHYNTWGKYIVKTIDEIPNGSIKRDFIKRMLKYGYK